MVLTLIWVFHVIKHNKERFNKSFYAIMQQICSPKNISRISDIDKASSESVVQGGLQCTKY